MRMGCCIVWVLSENLSKVEKPDDCENGALELEVTSIVLIGYFEKFSSFINCYFALLVTYFSFAPLLRSLSYKKHN